MKTEVLPILVDEELISRVCSVCLECYREFYRDVVSQYREHSKNADPQKMRGSVYLLLAIERRSTVLKHLYDASGRIITSQTA